MGNCCCPSDKEDNDKDNDNKYTQGKTEPNSREEDEFSRSSSNVSYGSVSQSEHPQQDRMSASYEHDRGAPVGGDLKSSEKSRRSQHRASALDRRLTTDMIIRDLHHNVATELQGRMSHWDPPPHSDKHEVYEIDREEDIVYGDDGHYKVERHIEVTTPYHLKRASSVLAPPDIIIQAPVHRPLHHTTRPRSYTNPDHRDFTSFRSPTLAGSLPRRDARDDVVYQFAPHKGPSESMLLYNSGRRPVTQSLRPAFHSSRTANESGLSARTYEHESSYYYDRW